MKFKVHLGGQPYNLYHGSQIYNVMGPNFYRFGPTTLNLAPDAHPWTFSTVTNTAASQKLDGWSEVELSNTWVQALDKAAMSIDAEADIYYTTWGFMFSDDPSADFDVSPNIPNSSSFIDHLINNFFASYSGFYCNLTYAGDDDSYELSQIMPTSSLIDSDPSFYSWLQQNMGTGQGLIDIEMFDGILTFTHVQRPNSYIQPSSTTYQSANLYFGWLPRDGVNGDGTYSYLVYLGCEISNRSDYAVYSVNDDSFFGSPEDVYLNLTYHQELS